ncbi:MAG: hypothetical protein WCI77_06160 [Candidatus Omnitrophota bacterium]
MKNKLRILSKDFSSILKNISRLSDSAGIRVYLVGGVVRDLILGKNIVDLDIVVEGDAILFAQAFAHTHKKQFKKHHSFGTATVYYDQYQIDFATARQETYAHAGALPSVEPAELSRDLARRDFTINAMAISLNRDDYGTLIDLHNGLIDLKRGLIRVLHENSFLDDPTRILRAIKFEQRFSFTIEKKTRCLLQTALRRGALRWVNPHRLRDELIPILKEPQPCRYIKRINSLGAFSFIDKKLRLTKQDMLLLQRIEQAIIFYLKRCHTHRKLEEWLLYLCAITCKLSSGSINHFVERFGLHKGDKIRVLSAHTNRSRIQRLRTGLVPHEIYQFLNPFSFECILFFYAYYPDKRIRKHIALFFSKLVQVRLRLKGADLKRLGFKPCTIYGTILEKLLYMKLDKGFSTFRQELNAAQGLAVRLFGTHGTLELKVNH